MSDNGKKNRLLVRAELDKDGKMHVEFGTVSNVAIMSHAIKLINLEYDNLLIGLQAKKAAESIQVPRGLIV